MDVGLGQETPREQQLAAALRQAESEKALSPGSRCLGAAAYDSEITELL